MMKAAIQEMQDLALFEPKMTRSRLKEVSIPTWNISPIKRALEVKPPSLLTSLWRRRRTALMKSTAPIRRMRLQRRRFGETWTAQAHRHGVPEGRGPGPLYTLGCDENRFDSPRQKPRQPRHLRVETVPLGPKTAPSWRSFTQWRTSWNSAPSAPNSSSL